METEGAQWLPGAGVEGRATGAEFLFWSKENSQTLVMVTDAQLCEHTKNI